ncbi:MAG: DUF1579 family protein [Verrucomicrobiales bacterium]|nr:DUF1579 family protein [Verrucomicrobiales bacterium]
MLQPKATVCCGRNSEPETTHNLTMRTSLIGRLLALALTSMLLSSAYGQNTAPKPSLEHKKMEVMVGTWSYEGSLESSPFWPAGNYKGKVIARMVLGGLFLESRWEDKSDSGNLFQAIDMQTYDASTKTYIGHGFENDGKSSQYSRSVNGNTWTTSGTRTDRKGLLYKTRSVWTYAADGKSATGMGEYSADDGRTWLPLWKETHKRVKR